MLLVTALVFGQGQVAVLAAPNPDTRYESAESKAALEKKAKDVQARRERLISQDEREAAAARMRLKKAAVAGSDGAISPTAIPAPGPGGSPDYFGVANWANSPSVRKFMNGLPLFGPAGANNLGQYLSVGHPDTLTYPGSDYYEIELREFTQQMHEDLPPTTLRSYVQTNMGTNAAGTSNNVAPDALNYLGVNIIATKDRPVRVKFTNSLPTGEGGDLFLPVDTTQMGAGMGPLKDAAVGTKMYTENRATLHMHGGKTPWISDGTPHQWITPAGEITSYPKGVSVRNVPDMPDPGDGSMTFFYTNQQSARMLFYHDHSYGITRLNVYAGEVAGYLIRDDTEKALIADGIIPSDEIPLVVQDKTFVDAETITQTDPTWNWGSTPGTAHTGDLWWPHVYVPAQNPGDVSGVNPFGRWHYGPWFWPPTTGIEQGPVPNIYYDPINAPWEPPLMPGTPDNSAGMEAFHDTSVVNGTLFPVLEVDPKAYRFRILNGSDDRFVNLQLYEADPNKGLTPTREAGSNRYATAVQAAMAAFPDWTGVTNVIIASGEDVSQVDALSSAGLAGVYDAPLLLVKGMSIPDETRDALLAMPDGLTVHIVGGPPAVSPGVMSGLDAIAGVDSVERISGLNRYSTAVAVADKMKTILGATFPTSAFVVNGSNVNNLTDSLVAAPASVTMHYPILLVRNTSAPAETKAALSSLGITRPYIVGGPPAVSVAVATELGVASGDRISGPDRYATAVAFANRAKAESWLTSKYVGVAGTTVDALSGGVTMGHLGGPILLSGKSVLPSATKAFLSANKDDIYDVFVFGDTSVVDEGVMAFIMTAISRLTEVKMVPAAITQTNFPESWPVDGRAGGVPDPDTAGPQWVQIATEGGFLPKPAVFDNQPITWVADPTLFNVGNVDLHTMMLAPAERADVILDFSQYAGKTLILYNDAPTAHPALDPRTDYYTDSPDLRDSGGTKPIRAGFGPNTRTMMKIKVAAKTPAQPYDLATLEAAFASTPTTDGVFAASQNPPLLPNDRYDSAFATSFPTDAYARIYSKEMTFTTMAGTTVTFPLQAKAIQDEMGETFDPVYGRMMANLGLTVTGVPGFALRSFVDPVTEILTDAKAEALTPVLDDGTQIWKITQNGVDTHPIHFHLFDVQVINRVGWDGFIRLPDDNELGWKDTVRVAPLEDTIVALRPVAPKMTFGIPDSVRYLNPTEPVDSMMGFIQTDPYTGEPLVTPTTNQLFNFGWEYVWHCHLLSHEEMDMMRPIAFQVDRAMAAAPSLTATGTVGGPVTLDWTDGTPWDNATGTGPDTTRGNPANEVLYRVERETDGSGVWDVIAQPLANSIQYIDTTTAGGSTYQYRVVANNAAGDSVSNVVALPAP